MNISLTRPDDDLDAPDRAFVASIREFAVERLGPHARAIDEQRCFRREAVAELAVAGILGGPLPVEYGGLGWPAVRLALAHEEIGAVCGNTRGFLAVHTGLVAESIRRFGREEQRRHWLPRLANGEAISCFALTESDAGSDVANLATAAEAHGSGFRLQGRKIWITNGNVADVAIVFATVAPGSGKPGITAFLVETDRPGLAREPMPGIELGHRGSDHAQLVLDGVEVAPSDVLGEIGGGFDVAMSGLHAGRLSVAAGAVGIHRAALEHAATFVSGREQFGRPLSRFQMVQERLADMLVGLQAARALVHRCARRIDAGRDTRADVSAAKLYATEAAFRAAETAVLLHGGRGYSSARPVERLMRDAMGLRIYEGTSLIHRAILARELTG